MSPTSSQRETLTRERILLAACSVVDEAGLDALSMRKLGSVLGVEAMSLYNHVSNKNEIITGMFDLVMQEIEPPLPSHDWKLSLRESCLSAYDTLGRHPWAGGLMMLPNHLSEARLRWMNGILGTLRGAGCSVELTHHAYHALDSHIVGFSHWSNSIPVSADDLPELAERMANQFPFNLYPYLVEHMRYHMDEPHADPEYTGSEFAFGLDLILDGVDRMKAMSINDRRG